LGATHDAKELREHPFFQDIDWAELHRKNVVPPFKPKLTSDIDTSNFDPEFTNAPMMNSLNARAAALASADMPASTPLSPGMQAKFRGFTFVDESSIEDHFESRELERMDEGPEEQWDSAAYMRTPRDSQHFDAKSNRMSGIESHDVGGVFNGGMEM